MLYVAADYWQLDYTEGELAILLASPSVVSVGTGFVNSSLTMSGSASSAVSSTPLLKASMLIVGAGVAQALCSTGVQVSTAIAGNPIATATGSGLTYSTLNMSANGYAIAVSPSDLIMDTSIVGHAYALSSIDDEYMYPDYCLEGYAEVYTGSGIKVSTAITTNAIASAIGQTSMFSQMPISANGYSNTTGLANVIMSMPFIGSAYSQSASHGITFSTMPIAAMPHASAIAKCRMIKFVGYEFPIGTFTLNSVTPIHSLYNLTDIYSISSLTPLYDMNSVTPQYSIVSIS